MDLMNSSNTIVLNDLNESNVLAQLMNANIVTTDTSPQMNTFIDPSPFYSAPAYWVTYSGWDSTYNKIVVEKAENGFVLKHEGKLYIAKTETDLAKLLINKFSKKEKK